MHNKWSTTELSELSKEITVGFVSSMTHEYVDGGIPFLRSKNIDEHSVKWDDIRYISPEFHAKLKKSALKPGDVAIVRTGKSGTTCVIPESLQDANCSDLVIVRVDEERLNPHFLSYFMNSCAAGQQVNSHVVGAVQQHFNVGAAKKIQVPSPSIDEQNKVVGVLKTLDDKIQLNRQTNQTLENMAQALFKSWFVDFNPVIDNALAAGNTIPEPLQARAEQRKALLTARHSREGGNPDKPMDPRLRRDDDRECGGDGGAPLPESIRQLFPDGFVFDAEMGWVPEGWEAATFNNIASHVRANIKPENINDNDIYVGLEHIGRKQIFLSDHGMGAAVESNKSGFKPNDLLFGKLRPYFHKVCLAPKAGICSTDILVFRAKEKCFHSFMALTAYTESFVEYANLRSTGTRMPRASAKDMLAYQLVLPPKNLAEVFEETIQPMWDKGFTSVVSNDELAKLRDILLPKLICGELRIPAEASEAQRQTKAAVA